MLSPAAVLATARLHMGTNLLNASAGSTNASADQRSHCIPHHHAALIGHCRPGRCQATAIPAAFSTPAAAPALQRQPSLRRQRSWQQAVARIQARQTDGQWRRALLLKDHGALARLDRRPRPLTA